jgi:hypothetical protein
MRGPDDQIRGGCVGRQNGSVASHPEVPEGYVKIRLNGPDGEIETPWAEPVGSFFRLDNLPWLAFGISDDDIVEAEPTEFEGVFEFVRVVEASGNRLVRVIFEDGQYQSLMDQLQVMGCHYEGANKRYFAVSIPPSVSLEEVVNLLTNTQVTWEHANPTYEDLHPDY